MLSYEDAVAAVLDRVCPLDPVEEELDSALGRVLAVSVASRWDLPPADNSAMDGYALRFAAQQTGDVLEVAGFIPAGSLYNDNLTDGQAVKIMTGAPLPPGCDTVIPIEDVEPSGSSTICLKRTPSQGQHVRRRGEEIVAGARLLDAGTPLYPGEIGLLAASGINRVVVHPRPRVALLSTGDELVDLGESPGPGQIVNSNTHMLRARLRELDCHVSVLGIARDNLRELSEKIATGLRHDVLISTGGVSVGDRDHVQEVLGQHGFQRGFWQVKIKPGKPVLFGTVGQTLVFGLPGNPSAAAATFELFARPALQRLAGFASALSPRLKVTLTQDIRGGEKRQRFLWGVLHEQQGRYLFTPSGRQGSGQNRSFQGAQALLPVAGGEAGLCRGDEVEVLMLRLPPGLRP